MEAGTRTRLFTEQRLTTEIGNANSRESRRAFGFTGWSADVVEFPSRDRALRPLSTTAIVDDPRFSQRSLRKKREGRVELVGGQNGVGKIDTFAKTR